MTAFALLPACATSSSPRELEDVRAELRAMRAENARLEARLERLESSASIASAPSRPAGRAAASPSPEPSAMPQLTVVKLKPKAEVAPKISTSTPVVEPSPELLAAVSKGAPAGEAELDAEGGEAVFAHGVQALKTGNVEGGVLELQKFADESPRHAKADNALYFAGLGLMGLDDLTGAAGAFERVIARYPAGDAVMDSMLKLAECRVRLNTPTEAKKVYEKIVAAWPGTPAASQAKSRLQALSSHP